MFCSLAESSSDVECSAHLGSPVMCGDVFAGFLINDQKCSVARKQTFLTYLSVGEFGPWIRKTTRPDVPRYDDRFILDIAHYEVPFTEEAEKQCVGSAITERHIITAASCVDIEPSKGILVQKTETDENETHITSHMPAIISIHPDYYREESRLSSDVAILLVSLK